MGETVPLVREVLRENPGPILLINNSGFGAWGYFPSPEPAKHLAMIDLNVTAVVGLTAALLPDLQQQGGAILNIASTAAFQPTPYMATYGATKSFLLHWSLGLREELREVGIPVVAVCPGPTKTNFFRAAGFADAMEGWPGQSAEAVVETGLRALARNRPLVVCGWHNRLLVLGGGLVPLRWKGALTRLILRRFRLNKLEARE